MSILIVDQRPIPVNVAHCLFTPTSARDDETSSLVALADPRNFFCLCVYMHEAASSCRTLTRGQLCGKATIAGRTVYLGKHPGYMRLISILSKGVSRRVDSYENKLLAEEACHQGVLRLSSFEVWGDEQQTKRLDCTAPVSRRKGHRLC